uniref:Secreted protein n=1 Tax=Electrophorus electricus TaxID=8005 RepID=A0A4W4E4F3_ELEEL
MFACRQLFILSFLLYEGTKRPDTCQREQDRGEEDRDQDNNRHRDVLMGTGTDTKGGKKLLTGLCESLL